MIYFGGNHNNHRSPTNTLTKINDNIYKMSNTFTTHAYIIKNTIFNETIALLSDLNKQVDVSYTILQKKFNCYTFVPSLAWQSVGYSDIENQVMNYDKLLK